MHRRLKFLLLPTTVAALAASLLVAAPVQSAQAAAKCYDYKAFYFSSVGNSKTWQDASEANEYHQAELYRTFPCKFDPYGRAKQEPTTVKLFKRWVNVGAWVKKSDTAYAGGHIAAYVKDQLAAKRKIIADISGYGVPTAALANGKANEGTIAEINSIEAQIGAGRLTADRVNHVYKVLFYADAYYKYANGITALPKKLADAWDKVSDAYDVAKAAKDFGLKVATTEKARLDAGIDIPDLMTVYKEALKFGSKAAKQLSYNVVALPYIRRIGWAVGDSNYVAPTPAPAPAPGDTTTTTVTPAAAWVITNNSVGPLSFLQGESMSPTPLMTPAQVQAVTNVNYQAYLNRFAADANTAQANGTAAKYCSRAYTPLYPGDGKVMLLFNANNVAANFNKRQKDYSLQSLQAVSIIASGNAAVDAKLPATDKGIRIGSSLADLQAAYVGAWGLAGLDAGPAVGAAKDPTYSWTQDSRSYSALSAGNTLSFRLHDNKVVGIQVSTNTRSYEDTPNYCSTVEKKSLVQ